MVGAHAYLKFEPSNAVLLLAKLLSEIESWGCVWTPHCLEISFLTLLQEMLP